MKKNGFVLLEIIIGLFFIGLLSTVYLPIISSSLNNFNKVKDKNEMNYIGEMVVEKLKTSSSEILDVLDELENIGESNYVDDDFDNEKYSCKITKMNNSASLLEFVVKVNLKNQEDGYNVEYKSSRPK